MKRVGWIDAARYIAIFHVVFIHTLDTFSPRVLDYWVTPPTSYIPFLLNAKTAVLFFCVLLGFFAAKPRRFSARGFARYTVKRYVQFSLFLLVSGVVYVLGAYCVTWLFHTPDEYAHRVISDGFRYNLIYILRDAFLFEANYNVTMWSMQQFFIASIVCYLLGCVIYRVKPVTALLITAATVAAFLLPRSEYLSWIAFCVMGVFVRLYAENAEHFPFLDKRGARIALALLAWFLFKFPMPECTFVFFLMAAASILLLVVCFRSPTAQNVLGSDPLPALGKLAFGVYVVHTPINSLLQSSLQPIAVGVLPSFIVTPLCFVFTICAATGCAWLLDRLHRRTAGLLFREKLTV